jgi:hypothetical protein
MLQVVERGEHRKKAHGEKRDTIVRVDDSQACTFVKHLLTHLSP